MPRRKQPSITGALRAMLLQRWGDCSALVTYGRFLLYWVASDGEMGHRIVRWGDSGWLYVLVE